MRNNSVIGIDTSKNVFEICRLSSGKVDYRKRILRNSVVEFLAQEQGSIVALEACAGSHYWGRKLRELGHEVRIIAPQFVKPFVKSNKNDRADAQAIAEAALRPAMRFVEVKSIEQQEIQHLHRVRSQVIRQLTALNNELRGILYEYGAIIPQGRKALELIPALLEDPKYQITSLGRALVRDVYDEIVRLRERCKTFDKRIEAISDSHPVTSKLKTIPGVGPIIATAIVATVPNPAAFKNGRQFAAFLGLVPRHSGTGGKNRNYSISKRGDTYIRTQLIHGGRSLLYASRNSKDSKMRRWAQEIKQRRGWNRAAVAIANKNARIIWALLRYNQDYSPVLAAA